MKNITIGIGDLKVCRAPDVLVTYALGSCVGICLLDSAVGVGGLSHIMLPDSTSGVNGASTPMRFADTAIPMLIHQMECMGASKARMKAKIAGGATMFATASDKFNIGERNIAAVKRMLMMNRIPILAEDIGLDYGRTQFFYPATGVMEIRAAAKGIKQF
ncbi:MAG: chemotaxis protein CheD [Lachnospiraceae bacterium]|nr:chemotaxis protein CheD [Ruminococcus sp.]MCM1273857.1 chemotaxis protein CheD [Lachnospiraceae bacterium]